MSNTKSRQNTEQSLIDAVGLIIEKSGFKAIGVNSVAKQAGCDKVLIYRYFKNIDGLIEAFLKKNDYYSELSFSDLDELKNLDINGITEFVTQIFLNQYRAIRHNKHFKEVSKWELVENNKALTNLANKRELIGHALILKFKEIIPNKQVDVEALFTLLIGAINYTVLRSDTIEVFNGMSLAENESWVRIEESLKFLIKGVVNECYTE